jgi:hypothetical protein
VVRVKTGIINDAGAPAQQRLTPQEETTMAELTEERVREIATEVIDALFESFCNEDEDEVLMDMDQDPEAPDEPPTIHDGIAKVQLVIDTFMARLAAAPKKQLDLIYDAIDHYEQVFYRRHPGTDLTLEERLSAVRLGLGNVPWDTLGLQLMVTLASAMGGDFSPAGMRREETFGYVAPTGGSGQLPPGPTPPGLGE